MTSWWRWRICPPVRSPRLMGRSPWAARCRGATSSPRAPWSAAHPSTSTARSLATRRQTSGPALTGGCGTGGPGHEGFDTLQRTLRGYGEHPNFAGFLVIGLGCEVNQIVSLASQWSPAQGVPVHMMTIQELGGTRRTLEEGIRL